MPHRVIQVRDEAETYVKNNSCSCVDRRCFRESDGSPWENQKSLTHAFVVEKDTLLQETLGATQTSQTKWTIPRAPEALKLHENGKVDEDEKTDYPRFLVFELWQRRHHCTTFCRCGAKQKNLTEDQERPA